MDNQNSEEFVLYNGKKFFIRKEGLNFSSWGVKDISQIKGLESQKNIKSLILTANNLTKISGLDSLVNLEALHLDINKIDKIEGLENLINLKILNLVSNRIFKIENLDNLANLEELYLECNHISEMNGLEHLTNLKTLHLGGNHITEIQGLDKLTNLELLSFNDVHSGAGNYIKIIKGLDNLKSLRTLDLSNNKIKNIRGLDNLTNLEQLRLGGNHIKIMKGFDRLINLRELWLLENQIQTIQGLGPLKNLKVLIISDNRISRIKNMENFKRIEWVDLSWNPISEKESEKVKRDKFLKPIIRTQETDINEENVVIEKKLNIEFMILNLFSQKKICEWKDFTEFLNASTLSIYLLKLRKDGFIEKVERSVYKITPKGEERFKTLPKGTYSVRKIKYPPINVLNTEEMELILLWMLSHNDYLGWSDFERSDAPVYVHYELLSKTFELFLKKGFMRIDEKKKYRITQKGSKHYLKVVRSIKHK
ncbi:MAG: hypothetical protein ACFFDB_11600 [Promethearchaeota archaeon]